VTVAKLIALLQELPPDLEVYGEADDYWQMPIVAVVWERDLAAADRVVLAVVREAP
jgi:hypothetical protein